jgi:hypothetical protein
MKINRNLLSNFVIRFLNFFQTSKQTLYWSSLLAFVLALLLFPIWHQVFTEHNLPVTIRMAAPKFEYVKVYWDNPEQHPDAYERIAVKPVTSQLWQVKIEALGEKNPQAKSSEVWILDISTPENQVDWSQAEVEQQEWELREDPNGPQGKIAVAHNNSSQSLAVSIKGGELAIKLLRHPWSGKTRITVNDKVREVDLFAETNSTEILTFPPVKKGDEIFRNYQIDVVDTPWHRLRLVAENEGEINVKEVKARNQVITHQRNGDFILPFQFWNRFICTVVSTSISFFWMTILFISLVHLWQGQPNKRFGFCTYAISLSVVLAGFWTLVFYPGLMITDSVSQWITSLSMFEEIEPVSWSLTSWFPAMMSLLMGLSFKISNEYGLFTFIQLFLFYLSIILLLNELCGIRFYLIVLPLVLLNPAIWNQAVTVMKDVWTATSLNLSLWLIFRFSKAQHKSFLYKNVLLILFFSSCVILFGFRYNSVTTLPAIIISILLLVKTFKWKSILSLSCIGALLIAYLPPEIYGLKKVDTASASLVWEHVGLLKQVGQEKVIEQHSLSFVGDTRRAIEEHNCITHDSLIWGQSSSLPLDKILEQSRQIKNSFRNLLLSHPKEFLLNKACIYRNLLGFDNLVPLYIVGIGFSDYGEPYSIVYSPKIKGVGESLIKFISSAFQPFPIFTPWTSMILVLFIWGFIIYQKILAKYLPILLAVSLSYYAGYFILTPGINFRYFFPTYVILLLTALYGIERIFLHVRKQLISTRYS